MNQLSQFLDFLKPCKIICCAGSRNALLLKYFNQYDVEFHFDERSASFCGLGIAKVLDRPVVICVTSGTAVAECLPAMIEAYYSDQKLVIISGDRPKRLRFSRAPQAINQTNILKDFTNYFFSGALSELTLNEVKFPMHLNIEIDDRVELGPQKSRKIDSLELNTLLSNSHNILSVFTDESIDFFDQMLELNYLCYREASCNIKRPMHKNEIRFDQTVQHLLENKKIDLIIKIGNQTPVAKFWRLLDTKYSDIPVVCLNCDHSGLERRLVYNESYDLISFSSKAQSELDEKKLDSLFVKYPLSEATIVKKIHDKISLDEIVVVGNSMPIRYWELVNEFNHQVYVNRGANGIDGLVATSIGIAKSTKKNVHLVIGDLSLLYDLNNLWWKGFPQNLTIHCVNNGGGQIFSRVNVPKEMITDHEINFNSISFNQLIEYRPDNDETEMFWADWEK